MYKKIGVWFLVGLFLLGIAGCDSEDDLYMDDSIPSTSDNLELNTTDAAMEDTGDTWLVMLYQDADDQILEEDTFIDLNEAEMIGSNDHLTIVSQLDRYEDGFDGDGDWTSTKRFLVQQDDDLETINSIEIDDLGEVDMGDWNSLVDFSTWAIENYPADKYALILADHGSGWLGGWSDDAPNEGSYFSLKNIDEALGAIIHQTGIRNFEFVGFDACLMGQLEVFSTIAPYARYAVASEETEPALGWAYAEFLSGLSKNPEYSGKELSRLIVESYVAQDLRITDDYARRVYSEEVFGSDEGYSAEEVAEEMSQDITLTAVDLSEMRNLNEAVNQLAVALQDSDQTTVARARVYAQSFESVFDDDPQPSYIDLGNFSSLLMEESEDEAVRNAAQAVLDRIDAAVVAEKHGDQRPGATGYSIYFPNSSLFEATTGNVDYPYTDFANRFAAASLWDDFLTYHYTGEAFSESEADLDVLGLSQATMAELDTAAISSEVAHEEDIQSPVSGEIIISPINLSADEISMDESVTLSAEISGENIGYIYYYVAWYDPDSDSYLTADMGYVSSEDIKETSGIYYPDWGDEESFELSMDWEPTLYYLSNGNEDEDQFAFFEPEVFGATFETDIYSVRGVYTFADNGEQYDAVIKFDGNGDMKAVYGFTKQGALSQITPSEGDEFTITEEWLEFDDDESGQLVDYEGGTITFQGKNLTMVPYYGYEGDYALGFIVEDLDGNRSEEFSYLTVID